MRNFAEALWQSSHEIGAWRTLDFFHDDFRAVVDRLSASDRIVPPSGDVLLALKLTPPDAVRVVILGQDPYPTPGHAHGLAFSVREGVRPLPRSLENIFAELASDVGARPATGNLEAWARQGVLLLNTALTVEAGNAGSHARIGWQALTREICAVLARRDGLVWILWGRHAQSFRPEIDGGTGADPLIIESAHPSPLSARRGFFGSRPFSRANEHLKKHGREPIEWVA